MLQAVKKCGLCGKDLMYIFLSIEHTKHYYSVYSISVCPKHRFVNMTEKEFKKRWGVK